MDVERFVEEVFRNEPKVRYVGVLDNRLNVLISRMRGGVQNLTSDEEDRHWLVLVPNILIECAEKLSTPLGLVESVTIRYEKLLLVFFRLEELTIVLSFEPTIIRPFMTALSESMRKLGSRYLK